MKNNNDAILSEMRENFMDQYCETILKRLEDGEPSVEEITKSYVNKVSNSYPELSIQKTIYAVKLVYQNIMKLSNFEVPEKWPEYNRHDYLFYNKNVCEIGFLDYLVPGHKITRDSITALSCYSLITKTWLDNLANYIGDKKCLEVMCGNGMIASELKKRGINIIATTEKTNFGGYLVGRYWSDDIIDMDAEKAINKYVKCTDYIIMSWPPYRSEIDYKCLVAMRKYNPNCKIIYLGELGECCGSDKFAYAAEIINIGDVDLEEGLYHWNGSLRDHVYILK